MSILKKYPLELRTYKYCRVPLPLNFSFRRQHYRVMSNNTDWDEKYSARRKLYKIPDCEESAASASARRTFNTPIWVSLACVREEVLLAALL